MLAAFKEELKRLADDPNEDFHNKVRKRVGKRATSILENRLKQIILLMPTLVKRIRIHWEDKRSAAETRKLGSFLFAYLYNPMDFLSKDEHGLLGYLDDAYLVVDVYERVLKGSANLSEEDKSYLTVIAKTKKYVEAVIPEESKKIKKMVDSALSGEGYEAFASAFQGAA